MDRRLHNLEVAVRHLQEPKTTKIISGTSARPPLSPSAGWTFIAVNVGVGDHTKYVARAARLAAFFGGSGRPHIDRAWAACSDAAYTAGLKPYIVPHPQELVRMEWDPELERRLQIQHA
tara:strand:+ start:230 stop:586 length:357 start_codon:yes stop_codon:yes gene_type:complete